jgi:endoglucanase
MPESAVTGAPDPVAILRELSECPTAPYHEQYVAARIRAFCREFDLELNADRFGNLLVWYRGGRAKDRTVAFNAHMDHPALEVTHASPLAGRLLGGLRSSPRYFAGPVPIRYVHNGGQTSGRIVGFDPAKDEGPLSLDAEQPVPSGSFAVFDVGPFREEGDLLYQPAADDLAGCAAILAALARCAADGVPANVLGVFTRAEEVGLIGATLVARQGLVPEDAIVVSLEASRALPGAEIGAGPVIRVGDRSSSFHPEGERLLLNAAALLQEERPVAVQRQLMSGGTCEATAYSLAGYVTTGVAFPLGNYHNGGPDYRIAPEYIHREDLHTGTDLLVAAAKVAAVGHTDEPFRERLERAADGGAHRLEVTATAWNAAGDRSDKTARASSHAGGGAPAKVWPV